MNHFPEPDTYSNSAAATRYRKGSDCCLIPQLYVSRIDLEKTHTGICFANYKGCFLNINLTINWSEMGLYNFSEIDIAYRKFEELLRKKIIGYNVPFLAYAVFESGPIHGCHSHMGLHVPTYQRSNFETWLSRCIRRISKTESPNVYYLDGFRSDPTTSQWKWFAYSMKGLDPRMTEDEEANHAPQGHTLHWLFGVRSYQYGGYIAFSRVSRSRSISEKAMRSAQYNPEIDLWDYGSNQRYSNYEYIRGKEDRSRAERTAKLNNMEVI